ncbi:MAG TPA: glycosyltransferase family 87 protein [Terracidiphilus sp.]|nr:glycosyltransferase family 87 protein [Terracidiphilus sp.]
MTRQRWDGLYLAILGCAVFLGFGLIEEGAVPRAASDFRFVYNGTRCAIEGIDPYRQDEFLKVYLAEGGSVGSGASQQSYLVMTHYIYPPTSLILAPLAMLPWTAANFVWSMFIAVGFVLAALLIWDIGAEYAPIVSGFLVCCFVISAQTLLVIRNPVGVAISFGMISIWCFFRQRFEWAGVCLLAVSLMLKPHDAALLWLFLLLAGGSYRKRALQTLALTAVLSLPLMIWMANISPHWIPELRSNLALLSSHGQVNDPSPTSPGARVPEMMVNLQTVVSVFRNEPAFYNPVTYVVCGSLILIWSWITYRRRDSHAKVWFALATIAPLSMLPFYHRMFDAKLLLLTIPACAMLWASGGVKRSLSVFITLAISVITSDVIWAIILHFLGRIQSLNSSPMLLTVVEIFPVPLSLLAVSLFYLWTYIKKTETGGTHVNVADPTLGEIANQDPSGKTAKSQYGLRRRTLQVSPIGPDADVGDERHIQLDYAFHLRAD